MRRNKHMLHKRLRAERELQRRAVQLALSEGSAPSQGRDLWLLYDSLETYQAALVAWRQGAAMSGAKVEHAPFVVWESKVRPVKERLILVTESHDAMMGYVLRNDGETYLAPGLGYQLADAAIRLKQASDGQVRALLTILRKVEDATEALARELAKLA